MTRLRITHLALSVLLACTALATTLPVSAQPVMGEMGMPLDGNRMHERMTKHWKKRQIEIKAKLHLTAAQEPAWQAYVQRMEVPARPLAKMIDRDALAKLSTPERIEKMTAVHEANLNNMQTHIKQRTDATRTFYNQLSEEQQKVFDAETLPEPSHWKVLRD